MSCLLKVDDFLHEESVVYESFISEEVFDLQFDLFSDFINQRFMKVSFLGKF